jgi:hypothetical protein
MVCRWLLSLPRHDVLILLQLDGVLAVSVGWTRREGEREEGHVHDGSTFPYYICLYLLCAWYANSTITCFDLYVKVVLGKKWTKEFTDK